MSTFDRLPLVAEGESKIVRYAGGGVVAIRLKPTVYSFTHNRGGEIAGSDVLRLQASMIFAKVLKDAGLRNAYQRIDVDTGIIYSVLALERESDGQPKFEPADLDRDAMAALPVFTPLEVVVKKAHEGTPKHRYYDIDKWRTRAGAVIMPGGPYPETIVRFDWRNPLVSREGVRLADECMPEAMANWYIDVEQARDTALAAFNTLNRFLNGRGVELIDICFFISEDGRTILSEVSPDCGRYRSRDGDSLDKDVWRRGGSHQGVLEKWQKIIDLIS